METTLSHPAVNKTLATLTGALVGELIHQSKQALLWFPVFLAFGIAIYFSLDTEPPAEILATLGFIAACLLALAFATAAPARWLFVLCFWVILGILIASLRAHLVNAPILGWRYYGEITGTVTGIDRSSKNRLRLTLSELKIGKISEPRTPKYLRISLYGKEETYEGRLGDIVRITGSISPPSGPAEPDGFSFQRRAFFSQLGAVGYTRKSVEVIGQAENGTLARWIYEQRLRLSRAIHANVGEENGGFASAILTGDRSFIDPADLEHLRRSNLAHLLAISGLHMGLLVGFIFAMIRYGLALIPSLALRWPLKKIAALVALTAGASYLVISGMSIATTRAFIMVAVMLTAILLDRPALSLRAVALAASLILLMSPENLLAVGFQMSFAATIGLIAAFRGFSALGWWAMVGRVTRFGRGGWDDNEPRILTDTARGFVRGTLAVIMSSLIAGAATAPFSAYHFNQLAHYGVLANLLSVPVMGMLIMPSAIIAGIFAFVGAEGAPLWLMGRGIGWILFVAEQVAGLPGANSRVQTGGDYVMFLLAFGSVLMVLMRRWFRLLGIAALGLSFVLWVLSPRPEVLISDNGRLVGVLDAGSRGLNRVKGNGFVADSWLENDGDLREQAEAEMVGFAEGQGVDNFDLELGGARIKYFWDGKAELAQLQELCTEFDILIAPKWREDSPKGCRFFGYYEFARVGSVAFRVQDGDLKIRTARESVGVRLWSPKDRRESWRKWKKKRGQEVRAP